MNYVKPEVTLLGDAGVVIESQSQKTTNVKDGSNPAPGPGPAYDLDE